jgi:hypothetical protein
MVNLMRRDFVTLLGGAAAFAAAGGLLSYGNEQIDNFRRAAIYADRDPEGREAERASRSGSGQVRAVDQLKDG